MFSSNTTQVSSDAAYIEDVFSTWLYTGNGSTQTINNGIDLAGKGGLVWLKSRSTADAHGLWDTARGVNAGYLQSENTGAQSGSASQLTSFNANGFTLPSSGYWNQSGQNLVSWTFREQPKFFDVVTYTGNGANRTIAHNLGSVPGCIIVKRTNTTGDWQVYHRSLANTQYLVLNSTAAAATGATRWNSTTPTATEFSLGTDATVNANGGTYVAYLFAHDAGGFGATGADNVISCGSFTGPNQTVTLGYEPQWIMYKDTVSAGTSWQIIDNMRGMSLTDSARLFPNSSGSEVTGSQWITPTATGFITGASFAANTFIYIAIRRGPMRTPTTGTSVFSPVAYTGTGAALNLSSTFAPDMAWPKNRSAGSDSFAWTRLQGLNGLAMSDTAAEYALTNRLTSWGQTGITLGTAQPNNSGDTYVAEFFRRAPGFFDVVCYTGNGTPGRTLNHNLGVVPELMIVKRRDAAAQWPAYAAPLGATNFVSLNLTNASAANSQIWNDTAPTASVFTVGSNMVVNSGAPGTYVAYLFASCPGVSKVGSFTGTGSTQTINCGFSSGARFVLIKRTDSTGDWYVWDSARGIVAGNDPYLLLNTTATEVTNTDWVDTAASGFELSNAGGNLVNINGASYIFLSVA